MRKAKVMLRSYVMMILCHLSESVNNKRTLNNDIVFSF